VGATLAEVSRSDEPITLPNGLSAYGANIGDVRQYQFIRDYFEHGMSVWPGMTAIDAGANVGLFSLELLQRCGGDARLLAFEPMPASFAHLERNVRELFPESQVRCFRAALGAEQRETTVYFRPRAPVLSSIRADSVVPDWGAHADALLAPNPPPEFRDVLPDRARRLPRAVLRPLLIAAGRWMHRKVEPLPCTITTLSRVIEDERLESVDFLKIDVEGAELELLNGIETRHWPLIQALVAEVHDVDGRLAHMRAMLEREGFAEISTEQDWVNLGTDVFMLYARRATPTP
jgi:FkbM family methyltransferase